MKFHVVYYLKCFHSYALQDTSDGSETDRDTLGPLPAPGQVPSWSTYPTFSAPPSLGPIYNPAPPPSTYMSFAGPSVLPVNQSPRLLFILDNSHHIHLISVVDRAEGGRSDIIWQLVEVAQKVKLAAILITMPQI